MIIRHSAKRALYCLVVLLGCLSLATSQDITVLPGSTPDSFGLAWASEPGKIYELEKSSDLVSWERVPNSRRSGFAAEPILEIEYSGVPDPPVINAIESVLVDFGSVASFLVPRDGSLGSTWTENGFDAANWSTAPLGIGYDTAASNNYEDLFGHDSTVESAIQSAMRGATAVPSMFIRIPFRLNHPVDLLHLNLRMDDGFVAYLNGVPVATIASPDPVAPQWNATATESSDEDITRGDGLTFDLTSQIGQLVNGGNVLAIHGMNKSIGDSDFLMLPQLVATRFEAEIESTAYLRVASRLAGSEPRFAITEFMAVNDGLMVDEDGDTPDWIEITNIGDAIASLRGWALTDSRNNLNKWAFPDSVLDVGERLIVFASGKDRRDLAGEMHTNFNLSRDGEYLALIAADGVTAASVFDPNAGDVGEQFANISYGIPASGGVPGYFTTPTPGTLNGNDVLNAGPAITSLAHDPAHGTEAQPITVTAMLKQRAHRRSRTHL
jgi:hypothetical protein